MGILNARRYSEVAYCALRLEYWTGSEKSRYPSAVMYQFTDIVYSDFASVRLVVP